MRNGGNRHATRALMPIAVSDCDESTTGNGAGTRIRTRDLLITNQLLYQLSYAGLAGNREGGIVEQSQTGKHPEGQISPA